MQENTKMLMHLYSSVNNSDYYIIDNRIQELNTLEKNLTIDYSNARILRKKPWIYFSFAKRSKVEDFSSGWKIHVSANLSNYLEIFNRVAEFCIVNEINFKFLATENYFRNMNSKDIDRTSVGKFIVIYPPADEFVSVINDLDLITQKFDGPEILTDYRFKSSNVVHYRYGEIFPIWKINEFGTITTYIEDNMGNLTIDNKEPYPSTPDWAYSPFSEEIIAPTSEILERYAPLSALHFSSSGGVYEVEKNGIVYVMKEARKYTGVDNTFLYSCDRLEREFNILQRLKNTGIVPIAYELLEESGNKYLIEEKIEGLNLREYIHLYNPFTTNDKSKTYISKYFKNCKLIFTKLRECVNIINSLGIKIGDLSDTNVIVTGLDNANTDIKLIDFEFAQYYYEKGVASKVQTPGFSFSGNSLVSDIFKVHLIGITMIFPLQNMFEFDTNNILRSVKFLKQMVTDEDGSWLLQEIEVFFVSYYGSTTYEIKNNVIDAYSLSKKVSAILSAYKAIDVGSEVLYFPADPQVFNTNPYSIAHGGLGVVYMLERLRGYLGAEECELLYRIKEEVMSTFYNCCMSTKDQFPASLLMGKMGLVPFLFEKNEHTKAMKLLLDCKEQLSEIDNQSVFYGMSGFAIVVSAYRTSITDDSITGWIEKLFIDNRLLTNKLGLYDGDAGVSLAYLTMYLATGVEKFLNIGKKMVHDIMGCVYKNVHGNLTINRLGKNVEQGVESPFLYNGLAGVGFLNLYYYKVTGEEQYRANLLEICKSLDYDAHYFATLMRGLSGLTDLLISCVQEEIFDDFWTEYFESIILKQITVLLEYEQTDSLGNSRGFLGEQNLKISHDLLAGSSGIILVISRYIEWLSGKVTPPTEFTLQLVDKLYKEWEESYL